MTKIGATPEPQKNLSPRELEQVQKQNPSDTLIIAKIVGNDGNLIDTEQEVDFEEFLKDSKKNFEDFCQANQDEFGNFSRQSFGIQGKIEKNDKEVGHILPILCDDGTSLTINFKDGVITKYSPDGKKIGQRPLTSEEKLLTAQDLVDKISKNSEIQENADDTKESDVTLEAKRVLEPTEKSDTEPAEEVSTERVKEDSVGSTQDNNEKKFEDIIKNLKPGESVQYIDSDGHDLTGSFFKIKTTVTITKNEDGTTTVSKFKDKYRGPLKTKYDKNNQKISEDFIDTEKISWGVSSTKHYEDGKVAYITTSLSNIDKNVDLTPLIYGFTKKPKYNGAEIRDNNGKILYTIKDNQFYNSKGRPVDGYKVTQQIKKAIEEGEPIELYQNVNQ